MADVFAVDRGDFSFEDYAEEWDYESPYREVEPWEVEEFQQNTREYYDLLPSEFTTRSIMVPDPHTRTMTPFSFEDRPYLRRIYDTPTDRILLMAGRQVEKSSTLAYKTLGLSCLIPHFKTLFVTPSSTQTKEFSKAKLKETLETSPTLRSWFPGDLTDNVFEKMAINRSAIKLRYAFLNADRCRGISSDLICLDEIQDILLDNIPVIEESASHSPFKKFIYSGTPKTQDNPIHVFWENHSTMNEWAVPCEMHGTKNHPGSWHWNILDEKNIGLKSLICDKCGSQIYANHPKAAWVQTGSPDTSQNIYEGFRIPQLMVPWIDWQDIISKKEQYPRPKFFNEVLGISFDSGQRPLTRQDIMDNCDPDMKLTGDYIRELKKTKLVGQRIYAGVDWGQDSTNSYTVIVLGAYFDGFFRIFAMHRFTGAETEPKVQLEKIERFIDTFNIHRICTDYGGGFWPNSALRTRYGSTRIQPIQYSTPRTFMKHDPRLGRYLIHRSEVMSALFTAIKKRTVFRFPRWRDFQSPFASDMLATFSEYNERTRMTEYKKSLNTTDDTFHAVLFCFLASMFDYPREDIFVPGARVDRGLAMNN